MSRAVCFYAGFDETRQGEIADSLDLLSYICISEYVNGQAHTNGIESFWALLKRGYHGPYHKMSEKHLGRYINEFAGRRNVRPLDTLEQMTLLTAGIVGKRLRYQDLVA